MGGDVIPGSTSYGVHWVVAVEKCEVEGFFAFSIKTAQQLFDPYLTTNGGR